MTDVQRVTAPGSPFNGRDRAVAFVVMIGLAIALTKPWGDLDGPDPNATPFPVTTLAPASAAPDDLAGHGYDPQLYRAFEPAPSWSIWPAGYFVSVRYVTRQAVERPELGPVDGPSASPGSAPAASPSPSPVSEPPPVDGGPDWPAGIEVGPGDHLLWLGIDTPLGWAFRRTVLYRIDADGSSHRVPITRLRSEWDDHFAVLGIPVEGNPDRLIAWPPGTYRLEITVDPGRITRSIRVTIMTAPDEAPAPVPVRP